MDSDAALAAHSPRNMLHYCASCISNGIEKVLF